MGGNRDRLGAVGAVWDRVGPLGTVWDPCGTQFLYVVKRFWGNDQMWPFMTHGDRLGPIGLTDGTAAEEPVTIFSPRKNNSKIIYWISQTHCTITDSEWKQRVCVCLATAQSTTLDKSRLCNRTNLTELNTRLQGTPLGMLAVPCRGWGSLTLIFSI